MRPHALFTALVAAVAAIGWSPATTLAQGPNLGAVVEAAGAPAVPVGAPPAEPVVKAAEPVVKAVGEPVEKVAAEPVVKAPAGPADVPATPVATPTRAMRSSRARTARPAAAMRGGAEPSQDVDGTRVTDGGLGSSTIGRRDGGVEDGMRVDAAVGAAAGELADAVRPPTAAPPVIAAADPPRSLRAAPLRVALPSAAGPLRAAGLRSLKERSAGSLLAPDVSRSLTSGARRHVPPARRAPGEPRTATAGTSMTAGFAPPPTGVAFVLLAATPVGAAAIFSVLLTHPARGGPIPFFSLLERPG